MRQGSYWDPSEAWSLDASVQTAEDFVWSTSEQARLRALSLFVIRSIVERYGGTVEVDLATDTLNIDIPEDKQLACAQEIEEQVGNMCA